MQLAVVFNPTRTRRARLERLVDPASAAAGWAETLWMETTAEDPGAGMAREAVELGADVVLAVGGDGTVRAVAEGLRDTGVPLALAPQGTANLLARNLSLPLDNLRQSVATALGGTARPIDLGIATLTRADGTSEERAFAVAAGMGLDAKIMSTTDERLKRRVGMLAYVKAGVGAVLTDHRIRMSVRLDEGEPRRARVHTLLIGNCGSIGGNVQLLPDAAVDDGVLDVVEFVPRGVFGWPRVAWKVLVDNWVLRRTRSEFVRRNRDRSRELHYHRCRRIDVRFRRPEEVELDGDHFGEISHLHVRVDEGALLVQLPRAARLRGVAGPMR